jgi:hypothetical protein
MGGDAMTASDLDLLTHHEAGHAAVAHLSCGFRLRAVWIDRRTGTGKTYLADWAQPTPVQTVVIALAGGQAELVLDPSSLVQRPSTIDDEILAQQLVERRPRVRLMHCHEEYADRICDKMDTRLAACSKRLVAQNWDAVQRLAAELSKRNELSGQEAERVLAGKSNK